MRPIAALLVSVLLVAFPASRGEAAFDPARMRSDGALGGFSGVLARAGIVGVDVDGDGIEEILVANDRSWCLLVHQPGLGWRQAYHVETEFPSSAWYPSVRIGDVDGDGMREVVLFRNGAADVFDLATGQLERSLSFTGQWASVADVDPLPGDEFVSSSVAGVEVFSIAGGSLWTVPGTGGHSAVGQLDADPSLEIVARNSLSGTGVVIDVASRSIQWDAGEDFGWTATADIDGDGIDEILGSGGAWDAVALAARWRSAEPRGHPTAADVDYDGDLDAVYTNFAFDGRNGRRLLEVGATDDGYDVADFDGDCRLDVVTLGGAEPWIWRDDVRVRPLGVGTPTWSSIPALAPPHGFALADVDGNGSVDILRVVESPTEEYFKVHLLVTDFASRRDVVAPRELPGFATNYTLRTLAVVQSDADPALEILTADAQEGIIRLVDSASALEEWSRDLSATDKVTSVAAGSIASVGTGFAALSPLAGTPTARLVGLALADGLDAWRSDPLGPAGRLVDLRARHLDRDGTSELFVVQEGVGVLAYRLPGTAPAWTASLPAATCLDVADLDGDGMLEALAGASDGSIAIVDATTGVPGPTLTVATDRLHAVLVDDVDGDGQVELLFTHGDGLTGGFGASRLAVARVDGTVSWESGILVGSAGAASSLAVGDPDGDGAREILVGTQGAVRVFEHALGLPDTAPPVLAGPPTVAAATCCPAIDIAWAAATDALSPPITYEIHRDMDPVFTPSPATLLAVREGSAYRDVTVAEGDSPTYAVLPRDRLGNAGTEIRGSATAGPRVAGPAEPVVTVVDADPCTHSGFLVSWSHDGMPPGVTYDLIVDGVTLSRGVRSPTPYYGLDPTHAFVVVAIPPECGPPAYSTEVVATDAWRQVNRPRLATAWDVDNCAPTGVRIEWEHDGFVGPGHFDLLDASFNVIASSITSPHIHVPPDDSRRDYFVAAVEDACGSANSPRLRVLDWADDLDTPIIVFISDADTCEPGEVGLSFWMEEPPGWRAELWRDGELFLADASFPVFDPLDVLPHDYVIRAIDVACGVVADSAPYRWQDGAGCTPGEATRLRVTRTPSPGEVLLEWDAATLADSHDALVGTVETFQRARRLDHAASWPGVTFADALDPSSGCRAASMPATRTTVHGLSGVNAYFLIGGVGSPGPSAPAGVRGSIGRDSAGRERSAVDPRPPACP